MYKLLFFNTDYVHEACNSTILTLSINYKKISLGLLNYRSKINGMGFCALSWLITKINLLKLKGNGRG